jgi:Ca2+-binding EF-hand superfamily protein
MSEVRAVVNKLFVAVAAKEEITEQERQVLAAMDSFEAASTFAHIDKENKGYVTSRELTSFMNKNGIQNTSEELMSLVIKFFDSMDNDRLNMNDFTQILLP